MCLKILPFLRYSKANNLTPSWVEYNKKKLIKLNQDANSYSKGPFQEKLLWSGVKEIELNNCAD